MNTISTFVRQWRTLIVISLGIPFGFAAFLVLVVGDDSHQVVRGAPGIAITGHISLQGVTGTSNFDSISPSITADSGGSPITVQPNSNGFFNFPGLSDGTYSVTASADGFLSSVHPSVVVSGGTVELPDTRLRSGLVDSDGVISIRDISAIAASFGQSVSADRLDGSGRIVDLDADGVVSILDVSAAASNFGAISPVSWTPGPIAPDHFIIECILFDGDVPTTESDEYVVIRNQSGSDENIDGWKLLDSTDGNPEFIFLSHLVAAGDTIRVYTNEVHAESGGFTFSSGRAIWSNSQAGAATLLSPLGVIASTATYPPGCTPDEPVPTAIPAPTPTPVPTAIPLPTTGFTIHFIDVGQGDATLIIDSSGESLLIDGGRSKTRIRDRLTAMGVTDIDAVLASHGDADHIAGIIEVFDMYSIDEFYWNGQPHGTQTFTDMMAAVTAEGSTVVIAERGDTIPLGGLSVNVLHPSTLTGDSNVDSLVVEISCGSVNVLLTADAESPSETSMLSGGVLSEVDVLKIGHHGSQTSTSYPFLAAVSPEVGVISAGLTNSFGHPHQEVLDRLAAADVEVWLTDTTEAADTVTLISDCTTYSLSQPGD